MNQSALHSATLRLTAWYTLILLVVSLLFSLVVFQISARELDHGLRPPRAGETVVVDLTQNEDIFQNWRQQRVSEGRSHLIGELVFFNLVVLSAGAFGSYLLARRTLRPVEAALESQTRFSSDAAHELRTPLTIMQSEIEVGLRNHKATKTTHAALLRSNLDEVQHMRTLTDRLLLLANNHDIPMTTVSLEAVAIEAVNRCIPLAQAKHIIIHNSARDVRVTGNTESLTDLVVILLENAIKYSPKKSTIHLETVTKAKTAEFAVRDTGLGVPVKDLPHIFDRFYRADQSRSSQNVAGHGLGLSIAKQIVEQHNGTIGARNNSPEQGATFSVSLPRS